MKMIAVFGCCHTIEIIVIVKLYMSVCEWPTWWDIDTVALPQSWPFPWCLWDLGILVRVDHVHIHWWVTRTRIRVLWNKQNIYCIIRPLVLCKWTHILKGNLLSHGRILNSLTIIRWRCWHVKHIWNNLIKYLSSKGLLIKLTFEIISFVILEKKVKIAGW